jgi:hypothetical protein
LGNMLSRRDFMTLLFTFRILQTFRPYGTEKIQRRCTESNVWRSEIKENSDITPSTTPKGNGCGITGDWRTTNLTDPHQIALWRPYY